MADTLKEVGIRSSLERKADATLVGQATGKLGWQDGDRESAWQGWEDEEGEDLCEYGFWGRTSCCSASGARSIGCLRLSLRSAGQACFETQERGYA